VPMICGLSIGPLPASRTRKRLGSACDGFPGVKPPGPETRLRPVSEARRGIPARREGRGSPALRYRVKDDKRLSVAPLSGQTGHAGIAGMTWMTVRPEGANYQ